MKILIIDKSLPFALGLKQALLKSRLTENNGLITLFSEFDFNLNNANNIDLLFIDLEMLNQSNALEFIKHIKSHNPEFKLIVSSDFLTNLDIIRFIEIQPNGLFAKSISKDDFNSYLKKVLELGYYIDFQAFCAQLEKEKDFANRSQHNLESFQSSNSSELLTEQMSNSR
jgi:DNA-binding NarL/FixJ family response regulator